MIGVSHDYARDLMEQIRKEQESKKGKGAGKPISRKRKKNIEKAEKSGSEVKNRD